MKLFCRFLQKTVPPAFTGNTINITVTNARALRTSSSSSNTNSVNNSSLTASSPSSVIASQTVTSSTEEVEDSLFFAEEDAADNDAHGPSSSSSHHLHMPAFVGLLAMHHIYCPDKRACILGRAEHYGLRGLYQFGKPGRVVVEGDDERIVRAYLRDVMRCGRWQACKDMGSMPSFEALSYAAYGASLMLMCAPRHVIAELEAPREAARKANEEKRRGMSSGRRQRHKLRDETTMATAARSGAAGDESGGGCGGAANNTTIDAHLVPIASLRVFPRDFGFQPVEDDAHLRKVLAEQFKAPFAYETVARPFSMPRPIPGR